MKKRILAIHIAVLVIFFVCMPQVLSKTKNVYYLGEEKTKETFEKGTKEETKEQLMNLQFRGESLPYDSDSNTFYLPLSMTMKDWEEGELKSDDIKVTILFEDDISKTNKLEDIEKNQSFTFVAFNEKEYCYYHLIFTGLPVMDISIGEEKIEDQTIINMSLYDSENKISWVQSSTATLGVRGATSRNFPKLSFKLQLFKYDKAGNIVNNDLKLLNMRKDNDWILYAMYNDKTKIRDKLSIDIWNEFGAKDNAFDADYGTKLEYVEVLINNEYYGIYGLMEPVDAKKLKVDEADEESEQDYIYKRTSNQGLTLEEFTEDSGDLQRCGFELKSAGRYGDISLKTWRPLVNMIELQNVKEDQKYVEGISQVVDINSAINTWLFLQIVSGVDNQKKNMYYVAKNTEEGMRLFFVPWDLDLTWGNIYKEDSSLYSGFEPATRTKEIDWETGQRIIDTNANDSITKVNKKWKKLRRTLLSDKVLMDQIKELEHTVVNSGAMERETNRWPEGGHTLDYSEIEQYAIDKMDYLDTYFKELKESVK